MSAPFHNSRKRRTREHVLADLSVNFVEKCALNCGFSIERIRNDYGIDLLVYTYDQNGAIENGHIEFQVKATGRSFIHGRGEYATVSLATADLRHWLWEPWPVIVALYDASCERALWFYVQQAEKKLASRIAGAKSIALRIPKTNELNTESMKQIRGFKQEILQRFERLDHGGP